MINFAHDKVQLNRSRVRVQASKGHGLGRKYTKGLESNSSWSARMLSYNMAVYSYDGVFFQSEGTTRIQSGDFRDSAPMSKHSIQKT